MKPLLGVASIVKWWRLASLDHLRSEKKTTWIDSQIADVMILDDVIFYLVTCFR